ncbi:hypothetical protein FVE85_7291 [Porphyridium purpureum]|uniref:Uncharacterized protein n=1 Tax=Porphyridium purpureum TaxID=35688 RepID=A0A5J4Z7K7_PORPP|nr:hypothetical protein FVE85_7291 [Porphyridium purpureum]|eukprot:POR7725..scf295_1
MAETEYDPKPFARAKLMGHVSFKGWQAGSLLGVVIAAPILAYRGKLDASHLGLYGSSTGLALTGVTTVLGLAKMSKTDMEGVEDRVYRLHYNVGQNRVDRMVTVGAGVGAGAMLAVAIKDGKPSKEVAIAALGGAALGSAVGVLVAAAAGKINAKNMTKEL